MPAVSEKIRAGVIELLTDAGRVYVSPTFWERIYLLWTFRNFHSLPKQVLNRQQRQLIDRLCQTAVIEHSEPIPKTSIIGAVENVSVLKGKMEAAANANKLIEIRAIHTRGAVSRAVGSEAIPIHSSRAGYNRSDGEYSRRAAGNVQSISAHKQDTAQRNESQWRSSAGEGQRIRFPGKLYWALIAISSAALLGILPHLRLAIPRPSMHQGNLPTPSSTVLGQPERPPLVIDRKQLATSKELAASIRRSVLGPAVSVQHDKAKQRRPASLWPSVETTGPSELERLQIAEAPESGFRYPVAPSSALAGTVKLKALIGSDGSVTQVEVLSGNPTLARAAVPAVRHWRYRVHRVNGLVVEAETNIVISFMGEDAVSVSFP